MKRRVILGQPRQIDVGPDHTPEPDETEYTGVVGPCGVGKYKRHDALSASDQARLLRLTGTLDPKADKSDRVFNGENVEPNALQREGMKYL